MRVLMLTPQVDRNGWVTGFIHSWIDHLARHDRIDHLDVICLEAGEHDLPPNVAVSSMGKEHGRNRVQELVAFEHALGRTIPHVDLVFGHMIPLFTLVAAPWAKIHRLPIVQWYTHRQITTELRIVHALADWMVTASPESFQLPSHKVTVLGHGIDTSRFYPANKKRDAARVILAVGRLSPIKHYEALIEATAELVARPGFEDVKVLIAGGITPESGPVYAESLKQLAHQCGVAEQIEFLDSVPHTDVPALYQSADLTINLCPTGGVDKAVLESMASGVPVVARNATFLPLLDGDTDLLWCRTLDPTLLADQMAAVLTLPRSDRAALGHRLCQRMRADYALPGFIDRLVTVFEEVIARRKRVRA